MDRKSSNTETGYARGQWLGNLCLTLPFILLYWADVWRHIPFFDETNAFAIAAASPTIGTLMHYVHYEGHPWLWYFLLWIPSRFTHDPRAMMWVVAPVGTAIYWMIGMVSPFTRLQKLLFFLSYFVIFEYTVMDRMYCIMFLLALLYVWRRTTKPEGVIGIAILLGWMANVDMTGLVLSSALLVEYVYDRWLNHRGSAEASQNADADKPASAKRYGAAAAIYAGMVLLSVLTALPSPDISWQSSGKIGSLALDPAHIVEVGVHVIASPWWPISPRFPRSFWQENFVIPLQLRLALLAPLVLIAYRKIFRRERKLGVLISVALLLEFLFSDIVYMGRVRHWGIVFIALLVGLWIQHADRARAGDETAAVWRMPAYALLGLNAFAGILAITMSWIHPFSQSLATAKWLQQNKPANVAWTGDPDVSSATIAEYLQQPVYFMECRCVDTFKLFSREREDFLEQNFPDHLVIAEQDLGPGPFLFIFYRQLQPADLQQITDRGLKAELVAQFNGADVISENHYIYRITKQ